MSIKSILSKVSVNISPKLFFSLSYFHNRLRFPQLNRCRDLSEILISRVLKGEIDKIYYLADKYRVREYIEKAGYGNLLTPLIGVYENANEIDFERLPDRYAIKMNYGAGMNIICTNQATIAKEEIKERLNSWLNNPQKYSLSERHYNLIERKILIEEFIDDGNGGFPADYKFMCMNGYVACVLVCVGRESGHPYYAPFDLNWNYLHHYDKRKHTAIKAIEKPKNLDQMVEIAQKLSTGLPFVRVDLYSSGTKIWFGEMTLTPSGCILHGWTRKAIDELGALYYTQNKSIS